jgi:GTP-binding protein EngB required for normal cell division
MRAASGSATRAALESLAGLADAADHEMLAALVDRLDSARLRVLVAGEAKRGKSTLVNALLGREILPVGVVPLTAIAATVVQAAPAEEGLEVAFADGRTERFPLAELAAFGTEPGNPGNRRDVRAITVRVEAPVLARGLEIVDTPGTGSVHAHNTAAADAALPSMDAAIFVLTADPPVSASERDLLRRVAGLSVALFIVLNKADYLDEVSLAEAREFTARVVADVAGEPLRVYPLSARAALQPPGDPGFAAFAADLDAYLETDRIAGVQLSVTRHARRLAQQLLDEVALAQRAARLPGNEAAAQIAAFAARLDAVASRRADAEDRARAQSGRLLEALNDAAAQAPSALAADIGRKLSALLGGELGAAPAAEIEREGRARLTALVLQAAEVWRREQARRLEDGLRGIDEKLAAELESDLAAVRAAAADLLGLDLAVPSAGDRLAPDLRFFYTVDEHVDQAELLAGAVRRRLPGEYGRRLARERLLAQVGELVGRQIGRARGDLQYRLAEATRQLVADVRRRYAGSTQRLAAALDRAGTIRAAAGQRGEQELARLVERDSALRVVLSQLPEEGEARSGLSPSAGRPNSRP